MCVCVGKLNIFLYSFKDYLKTLALNIMHQHPTGIRARKANLSCSGEGQGWLLFAQQSQ